MTKSTKKTGPQVFDRALAHISEHGWPDFGEDKAMANRLYEAWLVETTDTWESSGIRDSRPLYDTLLEALKHKYGNADGDARWCVLTILLELRARYEHQNRRRREC